MRRGRDSTTNLCPIHFSYCCFSGRSTLDPSIGWWYLPARLARAHEQRAVYISRRKLGATVFLLPEDITEVNPMLISQTLRRPGWE